MRAPAKAAALAARYAVAVAALIVFLFPLYWMVATALKPQEDMLTYPPVWWPRSVEISNIAGLLHGDAVAALLSSVIVALASTLLAVGLGTIGGYAMAGSGPAGRLLAGWGMAARMAPPVAIALPFLLILGGMGQAESLAALVVIYAAFNLPYVAWMMRGYFREVSAALQEMAAVAGMGPEQIRRHVTWPMVRGGFTATAAFTFLLAWNELIFALVLMPQEAATVPLLLARLGQEPGQWAEAAALGAVSMLPAFVALALMGRRLARSLSFGVVGE